MQGNNFTTNPAGNNAGGGGGQPTQTSSGGGQPATFQQSRPQQAGSDPVNPNEIPAGGKDLLPAVDTTGDDPGNPRGTGSLGDSRKPFRLGGGASSE